MNTASGSQKLLPSLGLLALIASCFNCTVGGGIFRLPQSVYALAGRASLLVYVLCFAVMLCVAGVFIIVGRTTRTSGGPYAYVKPVLGEFTGYLSGVLLWFLATFAFASVSNAYAHFTGMLLQGETGPLAEAIILALSLTALALFNVRGAKSGGGISTFIALIKILPLLLLFFSGLGSLSAENLALPPKLPVDSIARAAMVLIFAFTGVESALIPSGEIKNPERNLPRALIASSIMVLVLYLGVHSVSQSVLGRELGRPGIAPLAESAGLLLGPIGGKILALGAVFSTLGYLSAMTLSLPRSLLAFAEDGFLPKRLAAVSPRTQAPTLAIWTQVGIVYLLAVSSQFEKLAVLANLSAILMYGICSVAAVILLKHQGKKKLMWIPVLAIGMMVFLLTSVTPTEWLSVGILLAVSTVLFLRGKARPFHPAPH
jgi:APA family basic amino acid/polyamine antiporter